MTDLEVDFDDPASLRRGAAEARRQAVEIARNYSWATRSQPQPPQRIPLSSAPVDGRGLAKARRHIEARRSLDRELEASGLTARWAADDERRRKAQEADAARERHVEALESTALGKLFTR